MKARIRLQRALRAHGKDAFVAGLPAGARIFDIGCGNYSPQRVKALRPDLYYVGLDVQDYAQSMASVRVADEYRVTPAAEFVESIGAERASMDAVISSHNLEHCDQPVEVIRRMIGALKPSGRLYLSFPCEASIAFPSRRGSLCFSDDPTHRAPPVWSEVLQELSLGGMQTLFAAPRYRPLLPAALGLLLEPVSWLSGRVMPLGSTWALWGFESVIWAEKTWSPDAADKTGTEHDQPASQEYR